MNDNFSLLNITNMVDLKKVMFARIMDSGEDDKLPYEAASDQASTKQTCTMEYA